MMVRSKFTASAAIVSGWMLFAGNPAAMDLALINRLDEAVRRRFADPAPAALGMSRVAMPSSLGRHFQPDITRRTDFAPESDTERALIAEMERQNLQVGLYVFGRTAATVGPEKENFRALKGPAAITTGTPRPAFYPGILPSALKPDALPDWNAVYPLASRAMKSFLDGGHGFETTLDSWNLAVRPVMASAERCLACHNPQPAGGAAAIRLGQPIGGLIYAYRNRPD